MPFSPSAPRFLTLKTTSKAPPPTKSTPLRPK